MSFLFQLPEERIAPWPAGRDGLRSDSKLLVGSANQLAEHRFAEIEQYFCAGDLLVLNNTKVLPCRFFVAEAGSSEKKIELLLIRACDVKQLTWEVLGKPMRKLSVGLVLRFSENVEAQVIERPSEERAIIRFSTESNLAEELERLGAMPIPPYIRKGRAEAEDRELYQTVYAKTPGSIAAPTAGLHFTTEILSSLRAKGVLIHYLTLHVGAASFTPIREQSSHEMADEYYQIPAELAAALGLARKEGRRIICVGTTSVRALESYAVRPEVQGTGDNFVSTRLFISPPYQFKYTDCLVTNFHHPDSTHLQLVAAFFGEERLKRLYDYALEHEFRFLSYGDSMLLIPERSLAEGER